MTLTKTAGKTKKVKNPNAPHRKFVALLQRMGKALLFPIAMLPLAAIFLRIGATIPADLNAGATHFSVFVANVFNGIGNAVFGPAMPFLFAIGIAFGMTKDNRGEAAITGFAVMVLMTYLASSAGPFGHADLVDKVYGNVHLGGDLGANTAAHFTGKVTDSAGLVSHITIPFANVTSASDGSFSTASTIAGLDTSSITYVPASAVSTGGFHPLFTTAYDGLLANNVFLGIYVGAIVSYVYNRFNGIEMPSVLGFFSGRRLVPALGLIIGTAAGLLWVLVFPWIGAGLYYLGKGMGEAQGTRWANAGIMGGYGIINRLLIPFGLHNAINVPLWFTAVGGTHTDALGNVVSGDINIFAKAAADSTNHSGTFQGGFFPAMMFGLPALAVMMWRKADAGDQRRKVASLLFGSSIIAMMTGITEPIEFSFMFLAPALYGLHAVLTGVFAFIVGAFGIQLGFGFSAGLIDYILSIPKSLQLAAANNTGFAQVMANPGWMFAIGAVAAGTYYVGGSIMVSRFGAATPGRGANKIADDESETAPIAAGANKYTNDVAVILKAVGGKENISSLGNCATRLRFVLKDNSKVDADAIKRTKAMGQMKVTGGYQVIMGPTVEMYANEAHSQMASGTAVVPVASKASKSTAVKSVKATVKSVTPGTIKSLKSMDNGAFAVMGKGVAILPTAGKANKFVSPIDGTVTVLFPTNHAVGITGDNGVEILVHIGVDTVNLKGKGFKASVKAGDKVKAGDLLITADLATIKTKVPSIATAVVVTSGQDITGLATGKVTKASKLFTTK